jgi:hypothetical protein
VDRGRLEDEIVSATEEAIGNASAWAEIIEDMLWAVPSDIQEDVLNLALANYHERKRKADKNGGITCWTLKDNDEWMKSPGIRHWHDIMMLKALLIQIFVRNITGNNSPADAAKLLFSRQRFGTGSGELLDYIGDLSVKYEADVDGNVVAKPKERA